MPRLHAACAEVSAALALPRAPQLYVRRGAGGGVNAFSCAAVAPDAGAGGPSEGAIVLDSRLLELLDERETLAVLAHEASHLACEHGAWLSAAAALADAPPLALLPGGRRAARGQLARWARAAELTGDRAALLVAGDANVVISVLLKIAAGATNASEPLSTEAFVEQARAYDQTAGRDPLASMLAGAAEGALRHPLPVLRAREIDTWARSDEYRRLAAAHSGAKTVTTGAAGMGASSSTVPVVGHPEAVPTPSDAEESFHRAVDDR